MKYCKSLSADLAKKFWILPFFIFGILTTSNYGQNQDCCADGGNRIVSLQIQYTGETCPEAFNSQETGNICLDSQSMDSIVFIEVREGQGSQIGYVWFVDYVKLGGIFTVDALSHLNLEENRRVLGPSLEIIISNVVGDTILQDVRFHTSCSEPIGPGDEFGSQRIVALTFKNEYFCGGLDYGDAPDTYATTEDSTGPAHILTMEAPFLGTQPDMEPDGQPGQLADGDLADEDGIVSSLLLQEFKPASVDALVTNPNDSTAYICMWIDLNNDGDFDSDEIRSAQIDSHAVDTVTFDFGEFPDFGDALNTYLRIRVSTDSAAACSPIGVAKDGEVEDHLVTIIQGVLPIQLISFTAELREEGVNLAWATASEINSEIYTIERSADGIFFQPIQRLAAAGNSHIRTDYAWLDRKPLQGLNYYRLIEKDFDGRTSLSPIVEVVLQGDDDHLSLQAFPNPAQGFINLQFRLVNSGDIQVQLVNLLGHSIQSFQLNGTSKEVYNLRLDLQNVPAGIYYLAVKGVNDEEILPIVVY